MKKKTIFIVVLISLVLIIGLPLAIDWLIIGNRFPSNIENFDWVDFFGGYIGALIGAIVSLAGIIITIRYTNEQNKKDRELWVRPYCSIRYVHDNKLEGTNKIIAEFPIGCEPKENNGPEYTSIIYIKNIGFGPAVEFSFDIDEIDDGREHYPVLMQENTHKSNCSVNLLQPGEEAALPIYIYFNFDKITENDFIDLGEDKIPRYIIKHKVLQKYKSFDIVIHIKYHDIFANTYYNKITLTSNICVSEKTNEKQADYFCDILMKKVTTSVKYKNKY